MSVSDKGGNVVYRFVYDTYGELSDIQNANRISLKTAKEAQEYTLAELADAAGIEYLYNGKYGVTTDSNGLYYMRARYYDQDIKRFINRDIVSGDITNSQSLNRYCYVQGNPVSLTDPFGLCPTAEEIRKIELRRAVHATLDVIGIFFDGADVLNGIIYLMEGDYVNAALCVVFFIPGVGAAANLTVKYVLKIGGNAGEALAKFTKKYAPELAENGGKLVRNVGGKLDDAWKWIGKKLGKEDVDLTIMSRNSSRGNPGAIIHFDVELNTRQKNLLQQLPNCDSSIIVGKSDVNLNDLAALTAKTGDEFAMFTRGSQRMIVRGNANAVNINGTMAQELYNAGFKWSGHTHPGTGINVRFASDGDIYILEKFNQTQSAILDSQGNFSVFKK